MSGAVSDVIGVVAATLASFAFGAVYYGALGRPWMRAARIDPEQAKMSAGLLVTSLVFLAVLAVGLAFTLPLLVTAGLGQALAVGAGLWAALVAAPLAVNHRYQGFGWDLTAIDGLHWLGVILIQSAILSVASA